LGWFGIFGTLIFADSLRENADINGFVLVERGNKSSPRPSPKERETKYEAYY
jgi:hypothetical protein